MHPHHGAWAPPRRAYGEGAVTVISRTVPGASFARSLARWLVPTPLAGWSDLPPSVTVHLDDGRRRRVHVLHSWSWDTRSSSPRPTSTCRSSPRAATFDPLP